MAIERLDHIDWDRLWRAIVAVETGGHPDPANATGDGGRALGIVQIWTVVIDDVNAMWCKRNGLPPYYYLDRADPAKAREIFEAYLTVWGRSYETVTGERPTLETLARIWNGGSIGYRRTATDGYWARVRAALEV